MATANSATEPISIKPAVDPNTGLVTVNIFDGTGRAMPRDTQILLTVRDGAQNQLFRDFVGGPNVKLCLPFHNIFAEQLFDCGVRRRAWEELRAGQKKPVK